MDLEPIKCENGKYGYKNPFYKSRLNWRLRGNKIDFDFPSFEIKPIFDEAKDYINGFAKVKFEGRWGMINELGEFVIPPLYDEVIRQKNGLYRINVNGKWGLMNEQGVFVHEPYFDFVNNKIYGNIIAVEVDNKLGFINRQWQFVVEPQFDPKVFFFYNSDHKFDFCEFIRVEKMGKKGLLSSIDGHVILEPQFEFMDDDICCDYIRVKKEGKWGLVDLYGKIALYPDFEEIEPFKCPLFEHGWLRSAPVSSEITKIKYRGKWGLINSKCKFILKPQYLSISITKYEPIIRPIGHPCFYYVEYDGVKKILLSGVEEMYDEIFPNDIRKSYSFLGALSGANYIFRVKKNGKFGYVDRGTGTGPSCVKIDPSYDDAKAFHHGLAAVKLSGKWGYINQNGEVSIPFQFDDANNFSTYESFAFEKDVMAVVKKNDKWGYIGLDGEFIIQPKFDRAENFEYPGLALVKFEGVDCYIDKKGNINDLDYYNKINRHRIWGRSQYHYYNSADDGWDMIANDAGADGDYDVDTLREHLGID